MKTTVKLISLLLSAIIFASCTSSYAAVKDNATEAEMLGFDRADTEYISELTADASLTYSSYISGDSSTALSLPTAVNIKLPEAWEAVDTNIYKNTEKESSSALVLKAPFIYESTDSITWDRTIHEKLNTSGITADLSSWSTCFYKNKNNCQCIIYYSYGTNDVFSLYAYIELSESFILAVSMQDEEQLRGQMLDIIDSISIGTYDTDPLCTTTDLRGYMSYLVNYFNRAYRKGYDLSDINVTYLCFLYAYSNKECFYDIRTDLAKQYILLPEERAQEICKGLLGDGIKLSDYAQIYLNNTETGDGIYGGVDGMGYVINYARDYWQGDIWELDYTGYDDPLSTIEDGNIVRVTAHICSNPIYSEEEPQQKTLEYVFNKVTLTDKMGYSHTYYQLTEINKI